MVNPISLALRLGRRTAIRTFPVFGRMAAEAVAELVVVKVNVAGAQLERLQQERLPRDRLQEDRLQQERLRKVQAEVRGAVANAVEGSVVRDFLLTEFPMPILRTSAAVLQMVFRYNLGQPNW
jgi:hypothetical protein